MYIKEIPMKKWLASATVMAVLSFQILTMAPVHAAGPVTAGTWQAVQYGDSLAMYGICNAGSEDITSAIVEYDMTNVEVEDAGVFYFASLDPNAATDMGTYNKNTNTWTGLVEQSQCVYMYAMLNNTGAVGTTATSIISITSASDDENNVTVQDGVSSQQSWTIQADADLSTEARLLTSGDVQSGDEIEYQIDIRNEGDGVYNYIGTDGPPFMYVFAMPAGSTFVSVEDLDLDDDLVVDNDACVNQGTLSDIGISGIDELADRNIIMCNLSPKEPSTTLPANSPVYSFKVNLIAGSSLAVGDSDVLGVIEGTERGTVELVTAIMHGENAFELESDNIVLLNYNPSDLRVTINRCPGQNATTTNGNGCFRVSFNKKIYAPSFTEDDLVLSGSTGDVKYFEQVDDFTWEVHVEGITRGTTLSLALGADSVQDYSAIMNNVQVLGENTIRYEVEEAADPASENKTTANGTLARTGSNIGNFYLAMGILVAGAVLTALTRRRSVPAKFKI